MKNYSRYTFYLSVSLIFLNEILYAHDPEIASYVLSIFIILVLLIPAISILLSLLYVFMLLRLLTKDLDLLNNKIQIFISTLKYSLLFGVLGFLLDFALLEYFNNVYYLFFLLIGIIFIGSIIGFYTKYKNIK